MTWHLINVETLSGRPTRELWVETVDLDVQVMVCGDKTIGAECRLPPGHESADIPHIWAKSPEGKFRTIVRVSDRDRSTDNVECGE